jgi:beta-glucosidase
MMLFCSNSIAKETAVSKFKLVTQEIGIKDYIPYKDSSLPVEVRVSDLLKRMTLKEKIEQMSICKTHQEGRADMIAPIFGNTNRRLDIPSLRGTGGTHGMLFGTSFPVSICRGASWNISLEYRINEAVGRETKAIGANLVFGPTLEIVRHPSWGRSQESYGEDTYLVSRLGVASIKGLQTHVMAQAKTFILNSIEENRFLVNVKVDERTLREIYLPPFKAAVQEAGVASLMTSYNKVNGQYMENNTHLVRDILKDEWGFDGFVATDWWTHLDLVRFSPLGGVDVEMPNAVFYGKNLLEAVRQGKISKSVINDSVSRILREKFSFGLFDEKPAYDLRVLKSQSHKDLALEAAREGIVLLKNENNALPLKRDEVRKIAVIGRYANWPRLGDFGSSYVLPSGAVTPLTGIKNKAKIVRVTSYMGSSISLAKSYAKSADAVVVVAALNTFDEGEKSQIAGRDRPNLGLKPQDVKMINAVAEVNPRTIVVIEAGGAITMGNWINNVEGIIMAWYPGVEGGNAIAEVLFGDVNPSGKLPLTFPKSENQLYTFGWKQPEVEYGYYHGYRYFDKYDLEPQFPFGFGLSYTSYEYSNLRLSDSSIGKNGTLKVSFDIANTGHVAGDEIAQMYIGYKGSCVDRAVRDLKGFARVHLEPGEIKTVCLNVSAEDLAYYDVNSSQWVVESITYSVEVGPSSRLLPLFSEFSIKD